MRRVVPRSPVRRGRSFGPKIPLSGDRWPATTAQNLLFCRASGQESSNGLDSLVALRFAGKKTLKEPNAERGEGVEGGSGRGRAVRKGQEMPRNVWPLKNVATGVDAIPSSSDCLSRSIEAHGQKQAPFYPVHSRQRERWTEDGAPRPPRAYDLSTLLSFSLPSLLHSFFP